MWWYETYIWINQDQSLHWETESTREYCSVQVEELGAAAKELRNYALHNAAAILTTPSDAGSAALQLAYQDDMRTIFIDEAARMSEMSLLPILASPYKALDGIVMVGDPQQTGTLVRSPTFENAFAGQILVSLFSRLQGASLPIFCWLCSIGWFPFFSDFEQVCISISSWRRWKHHIRQSAYCTRAHALWPEEVQLESTSHLPRCYRRWGIWYEDLQRQPLLQRILYCVVLYSDRGASDQLSYSYDRVLCSIRRSIPCLSWSKWSLRRFQTLTMWRW